MIDWLKRNGAIIGTIVTIVGAVSAAAAYAESIIDQRVEYKMAGLLTQKLESVERRIGGVQEQVNTGASDNRVIKEQLLHIEKQQTERNKAMEKQLELIIKLIEQRQ